MEVLLRGIVLLAALDVVLSAGDLFSLLMDISVMNPFAPQVSSS